MNKNLLLIGGGGHAKSVIDSLSFSKAYNKIGIVDNSQEIGSSINGIEVVGKDANLKKLRHEGYTHAFVTVGSVGSTVLRRKLTNLILENDFLIPNIIDKTANISDLANIGYGNFIGKFTIINANVKIGNNNIMNSGSIIEHDCIINDFVHVAPGAILCGGVEIENDVHVGANSVIKQGIKIKNQAIIGLGSVVLTDIGENMVAYGNPAKEVKIK